MFFIYKNHLITVLFNKYVFLMIEFVLSFLQEHNRVLTTKLILYL